jgi:hypothetical protein
VAVQQAMLAVCSSISLKIEFSNYLLVAIQQAMLAVCMGVKMVFVLFGNTPTDG